MLATRIRVELNALVFDKTLKRKDVSGSGNTAKPAKGGDDARGKGSSELEDEDGDKGDSFSSKASVLNLFTIDVDRVSDFSIWCFSIIDAPAEIVIGTIFLYHLLGYAAFVGISVAVLFLPINHWASTQFATVQDKLVSRIILTLVAALLILSHVLQMGARDRRVSLMNEVLQSVRMIKFFVSSRYPARS